jgi:hypothetical protein
MQEEEIRSMIRLAAVCGLCMRMDDGPRIANTAERIVDAVLARLIKQQPLHDAFGKETEMAVTVVDGQRVAAPAGSPGAAPVDAQQILNAFAALLAGNRPGSAPGVSPSAPSAGPATDIGSNPTVVQTPAAAPSPR